MKKFLLIFTTSLFILMIFPGTSLGGFRDIHKSTITWSPSRIEEDQFSGATKIFTAKFTSKKDLENVKFWLTPRLSKYAVVEPESIEKVEKNKEYTVQIIVSLPSDVLLKKFSKERIPGLLFVTSEKKTPLCKFWHKGKKCKERRNVHPKALRVMVNVKKPTNALNLLNNFLIEEFGTLTPTMEEIAEIKEFPEEIAGAFAEGVDEVAVVKAGSLIFSGSMVPNVEARIAMHDLLSELNERDILIDDLELALTNHDLHKESMESGGALITVSAKATTVFPIHPMIPFTAYDQNNNGLADTFIIFIDKDTHAIHEPTDIEELVDRNFIREDGYLREPASTATHELVHAMIFRTSCFVGSIEEEEGFIGRVESLISKKVKGDDISYLLKDTLQLFPQGKDCLDRLGFVLPVLPDSVELVSIEPSCNTTLQRGAVVDFEVIVAYNLDSIESGVLDVQLGADTGAWLVIDENVEVERGSGTVIIRDSIDVDWLYEMMQANTVYLALWLAYQEDLGQYVTLMWKPMPECSYFITP